MRSMPDSESQNVPYQAYKSKRHSRIPSSSLNDLHVSSSPRSASLSIGTPTQSPRLFPSFMSEAELQDPSSQFVQQIELNGNQAAPIPTSAPLLSRANGNTSPTHSNAEASTSSQPRAVESPLRTTARKSTTLRRVPLQRPRPPSSPLGPNRPVSTHSRVDSISSLPSSPSLLPLSLDSRPPELPLMTPSDSVPVVPNQPQPQPQPQPPPQQQLVGPAHVISPTPVQQVAPLPADSRPTSLSATPSPPIARNSTSAPNTPETSRQSLPRSCAPYRSGFQPRGMYRQLSDDFLAARQQKRDGDGRMRVERTKLERRLEKLIALHFPDPNSLESTYKEKSGQSSRRASSIFELDLKNVTDAGILWRGVLNAIESNGKVDVRAAEQRIAPWEEDSAVSKCPLCSASFHPLTNRKHHCRLCGKIICSLPTKRPQRPTVCSSLFVVDPKTRKIEEVGEGVDYGVRKRRAPGTGNDGMGKAEEDEEKFLKGVRICRECRPVLLRQQYIQEMTHIPVFVKLYDVFISLEKEIEDALPKFQELIVSLSHDAPPTKEASAARKRILEAFAQYDALAKQIRALPCQRGPGSSQDRVQMAIMMRSRLFLEKNMLPLQSLPSHRNTKQSKPASKQDQEEDKEDPYPDIAHILQPLLEQEALLETFVEEATSQRKFEDVKSLKINLKEIRAEIKRLVDAEDDKQGE